MRVFSRKKTAFLLSVFALLGPCAGNAQETGADIRTVPIAVNLIVDGSQALKNTGSGPVDWLCDYLVERILIEDDYLTIWNAAGSSRIVFSDVVKNGGGKEEIKKTLKALTFTGNEADFTGAIREAASRTGRGAWTYTLLVSASSTLTRSLSGAGAPLVRYSRVDEHPGWRVLTVALDIDSRIRQAAAAYMAGN
jgi:hypothetical protein